MLLPARSALRPVSPHAVVPAHVVEQLEERFSDEEHLEVRVDRAYEEMDARQPALGSYLSQRVEQLSDETAQALGSFLGVAVFEAFARAFGARLQPVDEGVLATAQATFDLDEELRREAPNDALESDDVVAASQPHLVNFVRNQIDAALESDEDGAPADVDVDDLEQMYRTVLVLVVALSNAVAPPGGVAVRRLLA